MDLSTIANSRELWKPSIVRPSYWTANTPFVRWLVSEIQPKCYVELGTEYGHSYLNIVEAVVSVRNDAECFAIDTWKGDSFTCEYDIQIYSQLEHLNNFLFPTGSKLLRSTFNEALSSFKDESIDLLHIDGSHRYEDVFKDFAEWMPKVKKDGFVLVHDIHVRDGEFGVYQFWSELKKIYPNFELFSGFGLGLINLTQNSGFSLFNLSQEEKQNCIGVFETLGSRYLKAIEAQTQSELTQTQSELTQTQSELTQTQSELTQTQNQMRSILNSRIWRLTAIYRKPHSILKKHFNKLRKLKMLETVIMYFRIDEKNTSDLFLFQDPEKHTEVIFEKTFEFNAKARICVIVHVHYVEHLDQIVLSLSSIPEMYDLYVSTTKEIDFSKFNLLKCRKLSVFLVENRGRDILPFLSLLQEVPINSYDFFLKLHTKKSAWIQNSDSNPMRMQSGNAWRDHFIDSLVGNEENVVRILQQFEDLPNLSLMTAEKCLLDIGEVYGSNKVSVVKLMKRSKIHRLGLKFSFPAGSMYWARANLVQEISKVPVSYREFEDERLQDDGTMAHAIERFIGLIIRNNKTKSKENKCIPS